MHRGRGENRSACNDRGARASMRPFSAGQASRDHGRGKRENFNWNLFRSESKNLPGFPNLAARKLNRNLIIRSHNPDAVPQEEPRLDTVVADNVVDLLSSLQEIPRALETLGVQHILTKPDVQGLARAVLSSLHDESQMKLHRNDSAEGNTKGNSGSSFSCKISRGPALSLSLVWTDRQKQSQNQAFAGVPSHNPPLAASRMNGSSFPLQEAGMFGERRLWDSRTDMQQRQPNTGWWRRILFGGLAGAAGIRLISLKYPCLLLSELFSFPYFRRNGHQNSMEVVERRNWRRIPVQVATAISSRFCGSLSNSVIAAHFLLLTFELRNVIDSERLADLALNNHTEVGLRCCSCFSSCSQGCTCSEHSKLISRPAENCHVKSSGELDQALVIDKLLLDRREDIAHMLVGLARKGREVNGNSTSEEFVVHLAELIHVALSMPKHSLDKLLLSEPLALPPAFEEKNSCGQAGSQIIISFLSKEFSEGIELVFPRNTPNNEDRTCVAATVMDPDFQSAQTSSPHFVEGDLRAFQNSALLKSILLEKCKSGSIHSSKSSFYASDVESEYFFEACSMCLPNLEHLEHREPQMCPSSDNLERWKSTCSHVSSIHGDDDTLTEETRACHDSMNSSDLDALGDQLAEIQSAEAHQTIHRADTGLNVTTTKCSEEMSPAVATCPPHHFADHPTCISLRERRHEYGDQNHLTPDELKTSRWRKLVFWHGHCRQGNPSLYIVLGKAVQQLPAAELQIISSVIISQMEYAELNFFRGSAKQMNIIIDLWGTGLMRMPPLEILSRVGMIMNRDYAGRGGSILLINAPVMLSMVIGAIKKVILRPGYNNGVLIEKGFLEKKDQILFFNRNYKHALEKHFDLTLLPSMFGGKCNSNFCPHDCDHGVQFLERL